jgi:hypothetical protein
MFLGSGETIAVEAGNVKVNGAEFILTGETPKSTPENSKYLHQYRTIRRIHNRILHKKGG